jgi:hypothetical protein
MARIERDAGREDGAARAEALAALEPLKEADPGRWFQMAIQLLDAEELARVSQMIGTLSDEGGGVSHASGGVSHEGGGPC